MIVDNTDLIEELQSQINDIDQQILELQEQKTLRENAMFSLIREEIDSEPDDWVL